MRRRTTPRPRPAPGPPGGASLLVVLALVAVPTRVHPASFSVVGLADAKAVDFDDGIVWFLLLGSDAREGEAVTSGRADAIELVGLDFDTGRATAVGVPRDTWVDIPGHGFDRINVALPVGGPELVAEMVESLVGIPPDYVFTAGFDGFESMVDSIGESPVSLRLSFTARRSRLRAPRGSTAWTARRPSRSPAPGCRCRGATSTASPTTTR